MTVSSTKVSTVLFFSSMPRTTRISLVRVFTSAIAALSLPAAAFWPALSTAPVSITSCS